MRKILKNPGPEMISYEDDPDELIYIWKDHNESRIVEVHEQFLDIYEDAGWEVYDGL